MGSKLKKKLKFFFFVNIGVSTTSNYNFFKKTQQQKFDLSMEDVPLRE